MSTVLKLYPLLSLIPSAVIDGKTWRIPNILTIPFVFVGLGLTYYSFGLNALLNCVFQIVMLFLLGTTGFMGMGDIKLMMVIASVSNHTTLISSFVFGTCLLVLHHTIINMRATAEEARVAKAAILARQFKHDPNGKKGPFAPYLAIAYIFIMAWGWLI